MNGEGPNEGFLAQLDNSLAQLNKFSRRREGIFPLIASRAEPLNE